jgi:hypothetical protein
MLAEKIKKMLKKLINNNIHIQEAKEMLQVFSEVKFIRRNKSIIKCHMN